MISPLLWGNITVTMVTSKCVIGVIWETCFETMFENRVSGRIEITSEHTPTAKGAYIYFYDCYVAIWYQPLTRTVTGTSWPGRDGVLLGNNLVVWNTSRYMTCFLKNINSFSCFLLYRRSRLLFVLIYKRTECYRNIYI